MMNTAKPLHFFLGANTPQGFVSRFDQLGDANNGWREFVIKGGPGTGKSSLMKRVAAEAGSRCEHMELIHCSSDVDSLDAVILPDIKTSIADGTSPHIIEPKYPGAFEQLIDLSSCWDEHKLYESRMPIMGYSAKISRCHEHCCRFLGAANSLIGDTYRIALDATSVPKVVKAAARIAQAEFKGGKENKGHEAVRFLSAVTDKGLTLYEETIHTLCDRVYVIEDTYGATSRLLLTALRSQALEAGWNIITCYCPLSPFEKLEHLFIPALHIGFITSNDYHQPTVTPYKVIRSRRFTDADQIRKSRKRISFNKKAAMQMVEQASRLLAEAKSLHDVLEGHYREAMDFGKVDTLCTQTLAKYDHILSRYGL